MIYLIRLLIILVLTVPYILLRCLKHKKINFIILTLLFIASICLCVYNFETKIFTFKTAEEAFKYSIINEDILRTVDNNKGTFIIYGHECNVDGIMFITKGENGYEPIYPNRNMINRKYKSNGYEIRIGAFEDNYISLMYTDDLTEPSHGKSIYDNENTSYTYFYCKHKKEMRYQEGYFGLIKTDLDYFVNVDGNNLELK